MQNNNLEFVIDVFGFRGFSLFVIHQFKKYLKSLNSKLLDYDYYYHTIRILQNIPEGISIIFLGFLAVFNLYKLNESSLGMKIYPIVTESMSPEIIPGSLVFSKPATDYKVGDVISYIERSREGVATGKILTHRIISENSDRKYTAKGDANSDPDPVLIDKSQIQGKVVNVIHHIGYLDIVTKTIPGFLVLIATPSFLIIRGQLKDLKKSFREG
jgi:signal peptidase I